VHHVRSGRERRARHETGRAAEQTRAERREDQRRERPEHDGRETCGPVARPDHGQPRLDQQVVDDVRSLGRPRRVPDAADRASRGLDRDPLVVRAGRTGELDQTEREGEQADGKRSERPETLDPGVDAGSW
jgi:hypothetical protein